MATTPTQNPVPSESPRDLKFNAGKVDEFVTSAAHTYIDRFDKPHWTISGIEYTAAQAIAQLGYIPLNSFEDGAILTVPNQVLKLEETGEYYRWDGSFPKVVAPGSTPENSGGVGVGAWLSVGDATLRGQLSAIGGDKLVGSSYGGTVYSDYALNPFAKSGVFGDISYLDSPAKAIFYPDEGLWYVSTQPKSAYPVSVPSAPDSTWRCVGLLNGYQIYDVRNWGLVADGVATSTGIAPGYTDNTANFIRMLDKTDAYAVQLQFPEGIIVHSDLGSRKPHNNSSWVGKGSKATALHNINSTSGHIAYKFDAWPDPDNPNQPFTDGFSLRGMHFEGNANTQNVIDFQGFSRMVWDDVSSWGANSTGGRCAILRACTLNEFRSIKGSHFRTLFGMSVNKPSIGLEITTGYRAGAFQGNSSDNVFTMGMWEGVQRGLLLTYADQTTFIGGTSEGNSDYGLRISSDCRYNTFIGVGIENLNATTAGIIDIGWYSYFKNCYESQRTVLQGKSTVLEGGYFERVEIQSVAAKVECKHFRVNHWNTGNGGFSDSGVGTVVYDVYDSDAAAYLNTAAARVSATLSTTPVSGGTQGTWTNNTYLPVSFYIGGSTSGLTAALILVGGSSGNTVSFATIVPQQVHLEAGDVVQIAWTNATTAPVCSYRPKRGYN